MSQKIEKIYTVVGMTLPASFTLFHQNDHCWAKSGLTNEQFKQLFEWAKKDDRFWKDHLITAVVECDKLGVHDSPVNGIVKSIQITPP